MAIPRKDSKIPERVKKLEDALRRIRLLPSVTLSAVEPTEAAKNSTWYDSGTGNEPKYFDGQNWVPVRDETIAVAQTTADTAQSTATTAAADAATAVSTSNDAAADAAAAAAAAAAAQAAADALTGDIDAAEAAVAAAQAELDTLTGTTLPALQSDLDAAEASVATLTGTTIPGLAADIAAAQAEVDAILPITETDISDDAITTPKIAANAITAVKIAANTITAAQIAADAITASELAANSVTAGKIAAGTIVAADISAGAITTNELAAGAVTAVNIAAESVTAEAIAAGAVTADRLAADAIDGKTITGAVIRTAATGRRVEQTVLGFVVYDAIDVPLVLFPTDGQDPSFAGNVQAKQLTVEDGATLRGDSEMEPGSSLRLRSGVSAPKAAPVVTTDYTSIPWGLSRYGLQSDSTNWLTIVDGVAPSVDTYSKATGSLTSSLPLPGFGSNGIRPWGGCVKIGTEYFMLSYVVSTGAYLIHKVNSSGNALINAVYTPLAGVNGSGGSVSQGIAPASIGTDGTNILIGEYDSANARYRIQTRSTTTLSVTATVNTNLAGGGPVVGIMGGSSFDLGATRFIVATRSGGIKSFNSSGTMQTSENFPGPATDVTGIGWDGSNFYTAARNGGNPRVFKHTAQQYSNSVNLFATYTWYDNDATGGNHETTMSPAAQFLPPSRSRVTLTGAAIPDGGGTDDPDSIRFYIGTSSTRTDQWRQGAVSPGATSRAYDTILTSGSNPPSTNGFPNTAPASEILYDDGSVAVSADGSIDGDTITQGGIPVATTTGSQTLTNKSLTSPTITGTGTIAANSLALTGTDTLSRIKFGLASGTTNASAQLTITHGLGTTPVAVLLGPTAWFVRVQSMTSTTFTVVVYGVPSMALAASSAINFNWMALA